MTKDMLDKLQDWLGENFCPIAENAGTVVCGLKYKVGSVKRDIAIAFTRYHHGADPDEYIIGDAGYVLTVPSFWLGIPKELVIPYLVSYIDNYLAENITGTGGSTGGNTGGGDGLPNLPGGVCPPGGRPPHNCPKPNRPVMPPPPTPPQYIPCPEPECDDGAAALKGYYVDNTGGNTGTFTNTTTNG